MGSTLVKVTPSSVRGCARKRAQAPLGENPPFRSEQPHLWRPGPWRVPRGPRAPGGGFPRDIEGCTRVYLRRPPIMAKRRVTG